MTDSAGWEARSGAPQPPVAPAGFPRPGGGPPKVSRWRSSAVGAVLILGGGAAGAGIAHLIWQPAAGGIEAAGPFAAAAAEAPTALPRQIPPAAPRAAAPTPTGDAVAPDRAPRSGASGTTGGARLPTDADAIARNVDPGIVDINTEIGYGTGRAAGTGMVLTADGIVLTNNHVISGASKILVTDIGNGTTYPAVVVGYGRSHDIAVLQLTAASGLKTVTTAAAPVRLGAGVVAVGNAGGTGGTPSYAAGVVTALDQHITAFDESDGSSEALTGLLEADANVQPGDSGGPLVNDLGQVVGVDTAAGAATGNARRPSADTNGFAIPIADALRLVSQITEGTASATVHIGPTAMLGVRVTGARTSLGTAGASVSGVLSGGPADLAGIAPGDVITSVGGHAVTSGQGLTLAMGTQAVGDTVRVRYLDPDGTSHTVPVTLAAGPAQ